MAPLLHAFLTAIQSDTMALFLNRPIDDLLVRSRSLLGMTQGQFGQAIGWSLRTAQRWDSGRARPSIDSVRTLAKLVFPRDPALAAELAGAASETLESLGLVRPVERPAPPAIPRAVLVDAILCAAADAMEARPSHACAGLVAAFEKARALGVGIDELEARLRERAGPATSA